MKKSVMALILGSCFVSGWAMAATGDMTPVGVPTEATFTVNAATDLSVIASTDGQQFGNKIAAKTKMVGFKLHNGGANKLPANTVGMKVSDAKYVSGVDVVAVNGKGGRFGLTFGGTNWTAGSGAHLGEYSFNADLAANTSSDELVGTSSYNKDQADAIGFWTIGMVATTIAQ